MKNMNSGHFKIGHSSTPTFREKTLQAQEPDVRLLAFIEGDQDRERDLHRAFAEYRVRGEWFALNGLSLMVLAEAFKTTVDVIDPPSFTYSLSKHLTLEVRKYGNHTTSSRIIETTTKRKKIEVPYELTAHEAMPELELEFGALELDYEWQDRFFRTAFRCKLLEAYRFHDDGNAELIELRCMASGEERGFYVDVPPYASRVYPSRPSAERFFNRWKKQLDVMYNRLPQENAN